MRITAERAAELLGGTLAMSERLQGGDVAEVLRLELADGRTAVVKADRRAEAEARMLEAIKRAGAPAPDILARADGLLIMSDLGGSEGVAAASADLGDAILRLHAATGEVYGWETDHGFGPVAIPNGETEDWPTFWAERRLLPFCDTLPDDLAHAVEAAASRLGEILPKRPRPALLHGDLWSGNVMTRGGRVTGLIDPACYHGHAEVDLAMLCLFGNPGDAFWEVYGPDAGHETRRPAYQLWPALVHLTLFGSGYRELVERCLSALPR
ncbi:fructosamine kinase family protein [Tropicimonas sp. IMCC34011]|uniref:fructosamine kinase family protein n=1 Tax=Tropicimonas sp. IMCC34011 TaxID=2248759 RepID=UPI001E2AB5A2|nr:fructosamine kinase family protein [Tropicimonas sp. IMCC34011]